MEDFFQRGIKNNTARQVAISRVQASDGRNFVFISGFCFISGFSFVFLFAKAVLLININTPSFSTSTEPGEAPINRSTPPEF